MVCLWNVKWKATWHAFYVVQTWTHDVFPTWRRTCTLNIKGTLIDNHPYCRDRTAFSGQLEHISPPTWVFAIEFVNRVKELEEWLNKWTQAWYDKDDFVHVHGVKWKSFFFTTILGPNSQFSCPYIKLLKVRCTISSEWNGIFVAPCDHFHDFDYIILHGHW
jgi:hypothetical protein